MFKRVAPSGMRVKYSSRNTGITEDASGNATKITRQYRAEYDRGNDKNLGHTQIDSSVTRDAQKKLLRRSAVTY
jgi:hypothetical protein